MGEKNRPNVFLYPLISVYPDHLIFSSAYTRTKITFKFDEIEKVLKNLPKRVWAGGKIVFIQGSARRTKEESDEMFRLIREIGDFLKKNDYRVGSTPCC
jgi:hypothetical protein